MRRLYHGQICVFRRYNFSKDILNLSFRGCLFIWEGVKILLCKTSHSNYSCMKAKYFSAERSKVSSLRLYTLHLYQLKLELINLILRVRKLGKLSLKSIIRIDF